jgi:hypothetical protein
LRPGYGRFPGCNFLATLPQNSSSEQEVSSKDLPPSFQLESERNLVLVHVVVRDGNGVPVSDLSKGDVQVFDRGKTPNHHRILCGEAGRG